MANPPQLQTFLQWLPRKRSLIFKVTLFILICVIAWFNLPPHSMRRFMEYSKHKNMHSELILDTPGCKIPKFDPYDKTVAHLIQLKKPYICKGNPVFLVTLPNSTLALDEQVLKKAYNVSSKEVVCSYRAIYRAEEPKGSTREDTVKFGSSKPLRFGVPLGEEFLEVVCKAGGKNVTQYVPLVPFKPEVERRARSKYREGTADSLNVILVGIDSISKLNFLRHFKKTHDFLTKNMSAFDMKGYTKVGDNTFPNLVPLLTGQFIEYYWNESVRNTMFFDDLDFIWKTYSNRGYRTFYTEDMPTYGTFQYLKRGFKNPPTDYYMRPLSLVIYKSDLKKKGNYYCLNDQLETEILYGYLRDYVKTMEDRPHFSFTMVSTLTHDIFNDAGYCDEPTYNLLRELHAIGATNRSLLILFSDHGIRFGKIRETYIGRYEERMPFMYISLPRWFLERHANVARNLKTNQNRLITLFDVHATLRHLLDFQKSLSFEPDGSNGLSLLEEISDQRTCEMAHILPHWCPCQVFQSVPQNDTNVIGSAKAIVDSINEQLNRFSNSCAPLEVDEIMDARLAQASNLVLRFVKHENDVLNRHVVLGDKIETMEDFHITLRTHPGGAVFEGTVRYNVQLKNFKVFGISRINMYGNQSRCIESHILKKFCFCK